jgi:VWFA-related protein
MALGLAFLAISTTAAQTPTFRGAVDLVTTGITVSGRDGRYLTGLSAGDFELLEDGKPQAITYFASGGQAESAPEMHVGLLFDTSSSMSADIVLARNAAIRFLNTLKDAKDMTLVDFDNEVRLARYGQADFPRMVERIRSRRPDGRFTALYDALGIYLDGANEDEGRTILLLYTDGGDTRSSIGFGDLMTLVRASDVTIYAIGFLDNQSPSVRNEQRARLFQVADATGGQAFFPSRMQDIEKAYDTIVEQIRAQYTLGYTSTNTAQDGSWRKVEVRVKGPAARGAKIQSRKGYFAPYKP